MLKELHIQDFAIIDELHITLKPGFNILTGETGAGKSILIDAVALLLGGRADTSAIRRGASRGRIEGMFLLSPSEQATVRPLLEREGLEGDVPDVLWLARELRDTGRTVARVNGRAVSVSLLREIAEGLVDIHGQSEHLSLMRTREHLNLLDRFAGLEAARARVAGLVRQVRAVRRELRELRRSERNRMQRIDLLRFQVQEITDAQLVPGERDELENELVRLNNAQELAALASGLVMTLEEGQEEVPSVLDLLGQGQRDLMALARIDATVEPQVGALEGALYQIEDLARVLRDYVDEVEFNPKRQRQAERRLVVLRNLERKYGGDAEEILAYAKSAAEELETLEHSDERIAELEAQEAELLEVCATACQELSAQRKEAAVRLAAGVETELNDLRMAGARLGVSFTLDAADNGLPLTQATAAAIAVTRDGEALLDDTPVTHVAFDTTGMDVVEFMVAPNVGEGLKPMTRVASGGETARLMLALKTVLSRADHTPTLIFDEIDQGIGGRIGTVVGAKLWSLTADVAQGVEEEQIVTDAMADVPALNPVSMRHQVLCITHLPQLAGFGDTHFKVLKQVHDGRTVTQVVPLDAEERIAELAQMLGTQGQTAQQGAREILNQATAFKEQVVQVAPPG